MRRLLPMLVPVVLVAACGDDGSSMKLDASVTDSPAPADAALDMTSAMTATMTNTRVLDQSFYGVNSDGTLHVEVHKGGDPTCPQMSSPTPEYSLIIGRVPAMTAPSGTSIANFLDYTGDMLPNNQIGAAATAVSLTNIVYSVDAYVALDATLTFAAGTVAGHLYAIHCTSLDG